MRYSSFNFLRQTNILSLKILMIMLITFLAIKLNQCFSTIHSSLEILQLDGHITFSGNEFAATDFGNRYHFLPLAVLHPNSITDISTTIRYVWQLGPTSELTVAARGHGQSLHGQSQAHRGLVINMQSLKGPQMQVHTGKFPYIDVSGGESWINILYESLKYGLAPKSWTDYLHLTVGGTLSNAGISGQAFRHGPQISNVHQLEVVTGKGEVINCSDQQNADLFYSVLGGLGQFGIITRAKISLEPAPKMVKWIRVLYEDFSTFSRDQEHLITTEKTFDYIEGLVVKNRTGLLNNWGALFKPKDPVQASKFKSEGKTLFCLELAKHFIPEDINTINKEIESSLSQLSYIPSTLLFSEVSYVEFLDRVHMSELKLRAKGLWEIPHPWLNLLIPRRNIHSFVQQVFGNILADTSNGPVLIYPINKSKFDNRTSFIPPQDDIFYLVAFLSQVTPSKGSDALEHILYQNKRILDFCEAASLEAKQYLPHYTTENEWRAHFGKRWEEFVRRKSAYDPLAILAPGQRIFQNPLSYL